MEIKNCSIYPRYEESLPKISRIPEFALFMYHRHGKSNRVKCLPHSNGQALRQAERPRPPVQLQPMRRPLTSRVIPADRRRKSAGRRVAQLAVKEMIAERLADQKAAHRTFAGNRGNARRRDHLARRVVPPLLDARRCSGLKVEAEKQRRGRWREPQSVDREPEKAWIRPDPELAIRVPFQIVGAAGKVDRIPVRECLSGIGGIPGVTIEPF